MKVSVIINCYNYGGFVGEAIASALAQTHAHTEVVVVDDGSTDHSRQVIAGFGARVLPVFKVNGGQGSAYNAGFAVASGEIVVFLDADDWLYREAAARAVAAFGPGVSKVQFLLDIVAGDGQPQGRRLPREMNDRNALALLTRFGTYGTPPGSGNAYAATFLRQVLPMDEPPWHTAADSVPILLAPSHGQVVSLHEALGAYRVHKKAGLETLLFNNEPQGLWPEYERIQRCKTLVATHLQSRGQPFRQPMLLAPWEARVLALCLRFGGPSKQALPASRLQMMKLALESVWRWPSIGAAMRTVQSGWMICIWLLPLALARRVGRVDRALKGAAGGG